MVLANASLVPGLVRKGPLSLYSDADGTGTAQALEHRLVGPGSLVATSAPLETGRWRLRITLPEIEAVQEFRVEP